MNSRFVGRYASVLGAMLAQGILEPEARSLIEHARWPDRLDIQVATGKHVLNFRRMHDGRCDVHTLRGV